MKREKTIGVIVISIIAFVIVAVIAFSAAVNGNRIILQNGNLMEKVNAKRITNGGLSDEFKEKYENFCLELADEAAKTNDNVAFAPSNVMAATAFLAAASDKTTADELENALGMTAQKVGKAISALESKIAFKDNRGLKYSNTVWLNSSNPFGIRMGFLKENGKFYGLSVIRDNFASDEIKDIVNRPIIEATNGRVFTSLDFNNDELMNIVSGASFEAQWSQPVSSKEVFSETFFGSNGTNKCSFWESVEDKYLSGKSYIGTIKELEGGYSFLGLVPKKEGEMLKYGVSDIIREIKKSGLAEIIKAAKTKKVAVTMPQYSNSVNTPSTIDFSEALKNMGVVSAFESTADMSNMAPKSKVQLNKFAVSGDICLSATGCCPAKSQGERISENSFGKCDVSVEFNSSFLYFIYDNESGIPVYCGIMNRVV